MVVFTCNNCGDTIQKPKVAKHYEFHCRTAQFLTCVDCFKDFRGEEYITHTKCITEAERYGGKDYVPKASANKGEKKQQEWLNIVNNVLNGETSLSKSERSFLNSLSKHENIPRKRAKFLNFVKSALGQKVNQAIVESVWNKMEAAYKNIQSTNKKQQQENDKVNEKINDEDINTNHESNVIENQNNENISRENGNESQEIKCTELNGTHNDIDKNNKVKKKKSKKRSKIETLEEQPKEPVEKINNHDTTVTDEPVIKKKKKKDSTTEEPTSSSKNEDSILSESLVNECDNTIDESKFNWKTTILDIVKSKGEISVKKLQKKVISQYMNSCSDAVTHEKASNKFNKKLKKVSEIVIFDEKVKLA